MVDWAGLNRDLLVFVAERIEKLEDFVSGQVRNRDLTEGSESELIEVKMVDWAGLNRDLLVLVAERIEKLEDFVSFGSVCTGWHAAATKENFKGLRLWQNIPCLMLPMRDDDHIDRQFYSLLDKEIVAKLSLPNLKGKRCIESLGWFLSSTKDGDMSLLHPFSGREIQLPNQSTFPGYADEDMDPYIFMRKMVLSASPDKTSDYTVMVICGGRSRLAFWRPGDYCWNRIESWRSAYEDVTFYNGNFYAIDGQRFIVVCNPAGPDPTKGQIITHIKNLWWINKHVSCDNLYIVESSGKLLIVIRTAGPFSENCIRNTIKFRLLEVDILKGRWKEIKSLGSKAVFIGHSATIALDASKLSGIKANHIYFTDDGFEFYFDTEKEGRGKDIGIYDLGTGNVERFNPGGELFRRICTSMWLTPIF